MILNPTIPYEFASGEDALALEVNSNFTVLKDKLIELIVLLNNSSGSATDLTARLLVSIAADGTIPELVNARNGYVNLLAYLTTLNGQIDDLNTTVITGALPGASGHAGQLIGNDGATAGWVDRFLDRLSTTSISSSTRDGSNALATITYSTGEKAIFTRTAGRLTKVEYTATDGVTVRHTLTISRTNGRFDSATWS